MHSFITSVMWPAKKVPFKFLVMWNWLPFYTLRNKLGRPTLLQVQGPGCIPTFTCLGVSIKNGSLATTFSGTLIRVAFSLHNTSGTERRTSCESNNIQLWVYTQHSNINVAKGYYRLVYEDFSPLVRTEENSSWNSLKTNSDKLISVIFVHKALHWALYHVFLEQFELNLSLYIWFIHDLDVLCTPISTWPRFKTMISRSWTVHFMSLKRRRLNHSVIRDTSQVTYFLQLVG